MVVIGPSFAGRGRGARGRGGGGHGRGVAAGALSPRPAARQRHGRARHGSRPGPAARAGRASTRAGTGTRRPGDRCPAGRGRDAGGHAAGPGRRIDGGDGARRVRPRRRLPRPGAGPGGALGGPAFVVAVDGFLSPSAALADVVLPVAIAHERTGTTTNIEGRSPAWPRSSWRPASAGPTGWWRPSSPIASSGGLGVSSAAELWDEIERLAPSHAGITRARARHPRGPRRRDRPAAGLAGAHHGARRPWRPSTPWPHPGIDAVEAQGAPPRAGQAEPPGGDELLPVRTVERSNGTNGSGPTARAVRATCRPGPARPRSLRWPVPVDGTAPACAATATRCGSSRPGGSTTTACMLEACGPWPPWPPPATVRANPYELEQLGVSTGRSRSGSARRVRRVELEAVADDGVPRGVVCIDFNLHGDDPGAPASGASALIDGARARRRRAPGDAVTGTLLALGDPLFAHGVHWAQLLIVVIKVLVAFGALLVSVMLMIWFERKVISDMQARIGPNRAGPVGAAPDPGRRDQAVLQGGPPPRARRPVRVQAGAVPVDPARLPLLRHRARGRAW